MSGPSKKPRPYYWLSFLPALAYWWLEENTSLEVALYGGLGLSVLELTLEKIFSGKIHKLSRLNFILILVLGGISLVAKEGVWFKLQPTFTGYVLGGWLLWNLRKGRSFMGEALDDMGRSWPLPSETLLTLEKHLAFFFFTYATFMAWWALKGTTAQWVFWKTGGQYIAFAVFFALEMWLIRRGVKR